MKEKYAGGNQSTVRLPSGLGIKYIRDVFLITSTQILS